MKDLIKEVALEVAREMYVGESAAVERYSLDKFLERGLVELSNRAEAVGQTMDADSYGLSVHFPMGIPEDGTKLFTYPPIHDIEAIENRVAEACAKLVEDKFDFVGNELLVAEAILSGEWRKYK